jgi:hypothetical protein
MRSRIPKPVTHKQQAVKEKAPTALDRLAQALREPLPAIELAWADARPLILAIVIAGHAEFSDTLNLKTVMALYDKLLLFCQAFPSGANAAACRDAVGAASS